jgi:hypothetical protein
MSKPTEDAPPYDEKALAPPPAALPGEEPPAYELRPEGAGPDPDEVLDPAIFVIHGHFIYLQSAAGDTDSEPVYKLSRAIHAQGNATEKVDFQRFDLRVRTAADGSPAVSKRPKDVYTLHHRKPMRISGIPFQAWMEPQSRKTLGKVSIEKSPVFHSGFRALRVVTDAGQLWLKRQGKPPVKKGEYHFVVKEQGETAWQWNDADGAVVAHQVQVCRNASPDAAAAGQPGQQQQQQQQAAEVEHILKVLVPQPRRARDGLVALWCLWMLHLQTEDLTPKRTWEDRELMAIRGVLRYHVDRVCC